jgi:regulator of ribonuclease activity A
MTIFYTADLCDAYPDDVRVAEPVFDAFGAIDTFGGRVRTARVFEDNVLVKEMLSGAGSGDVLVVDGGGSTRCALMGGDIAELAAKNGWSGVVIYGCVRDVHEINAAAIGVRALASCPRKSTKRGLGEKDVPLYFAGVDFTGDDYLYADGDGLIVASRELITRP